MSRIILITGGARSGKSSYGEALVKEMGNMVGYIATAKVTDEDMAKRIEHHRAQRPDQWITFEQYKDFDSIRDDKAFMSCDTLLLDCVTIMVTNLMFDEVIDYDTCKVEVVEAVEEKIKEEMMSLIKLIRETNKNLVLISNEVGLGIVPAYRLGNLFRDVAGRMNQMIAKEADEAYFIVSGLPLTLK